MSFPTTFAVAPTSVSYSVETYEGTDTASGFGTTVLDTGPLPLTDYLEPVYQEFAENVRDTVLAQLPPNRQARTLRTFFLGERALGLELGELRPSEATGT
ncbi:hypothetical protein [Streptomyces sp. NPDC088847]|uniref:hypothetical protein n=1 Tax=Streptomyces sp. NPDC088847 TaxID=3365909 RepID=UPI00381D067E